MKGSIQKRIGTRGVSWLVTYDVGRDPVTGKRQQKRFTTRTRKEAEERLTKTLHELREGSYLEPSTESLAAYLNRWLAHVAPTIRESSLRRYRSDVRLHLVLQLGNIPLAKVSPVHVQDAYRRMLDGGLSSQSVRQIHNVLHRALGQAVKWRLVAVNVCDAVDVPRPQRAQMKTWTPDQMRVFLAATADHEWAALWRLALLTGMRKGEMLALRWEDVDVDRRSLRVRRTLTATAGGGYVPGEPKTKASRRQIALTSSCAAALRAHRARQNERRLRLGEAWHDEGLVFDRGDGLAIHPNTLPKIFQRLAAAAELPPIRVHDLRHTAATFMLIQGDHPKVVQERLGHSSISMTMDLYSHVSMDTQRASADRLDEALGA